MTQQVGSTSGIAPVAREPEAREPEAREREAREPEVAPVGASGVTDAGWPGGTGEASHTAVGLVDAQTDGQGGIRAGGVRGWLRRTPPSAAVPTATSAPNVVEVGPDLDLASNDPLVGYLLSAASAVDITGLRLQSPALAVLQEAGVVMVVPLISSGGLVGLLSLGPRRSERALTGINPGDVALLDLAIGGGVKLSTGVFVRYADAESFTLMTPQGHMFAGWITFSAEREGDTTTVQAQVLMRANDPLYEIAMTLGGHRKENKFWAATLTALGQRLGIDDPKVLTRSNGADSRRQWRHSRSIWHNAMVRSVLQTLAAPVTALGHLVRGSKSGMKSQPNE